MELHIFLKLAKVEILLLVLIFVCSLKRKHQASNLVNLIWPLLLGLVYWQLISPEQWSSPDGNFSLTKWQFAIKFCLILHASACWRLNTNASYKLLSKWLSTLLIGVLLVIPSKVSITIGACLLSHLFLFIFIFNRNKRIRNILISACFLILFSGIYWWFREPPTAFIIFIQWLPILSLLFCLGLLGNYCKNHTDTDLKEFVFYYAGLVSLLTLHFCILKAIAWSPNSINGDIAVIAKIGLAWMWVLLGFQWSLPPNKSLTAYSLLIPLGLILTLFIQIPHAKTFQVLMVYIPIFFVQFWWLAHFYQSKISVDLLEPVLLFINCFILLILNWWLKPVTIGLWNFSPTLATLFTLILILAIFGIIRRRKLVLPLNYKLFACGIIVSIAMGYFMSTISSNLYMHIRDEYKESIFVLEPVKS